ncbi:hypothetical protein [Leptothrix ochracea]|uniref:hypothetical protein n=1 Tax=Leptothrix ochracea TaxID=735331 RepID=UPI0034E1EC57
MAPIRPEGMASKRRWLLGTAALVVVAWSGWIQFVQQPDEVVVPVARRDRAATSTSSAPSSSRAASSADDVCTTAQVPLRRVLIEVPARSPFGALPPPVPPPSKLAVVVAPPPPPPAPVVALPPPPPPRPVLPYRFLGMLADRDGSQPQVFLLMGEKILLARPGEMLEGGFKLEGVGARELRFVWPADNTILKLGIDGVSS